jgi:hypothetical protein
MGRTEAETTLASALKMVPSGLKGGSSVEKQHSRRGVQKLPFARFLRLINFRLLQQYLG